MIKPDLFDVIELIVNLPEYNQFIGNQGSIIECLGNDKYEIEFTNDKGETIYQCALSSEQFIVVWQSKTQQWVSLNDQLNSVINHLSESKKQEFLNFARFLYQTT